MTRMNLGDLVVAEAVAIEAALSGIDAAGFDGPTNCPPWTVKELVVHIWQTLVLPRAFRPPTGSPARAADWYRRAERETDAYRAANADRAREAATRFASGQDAIVAMVDAARGIRDRLVEVEAATVIGHPAVGAIAFGDFVVTRVISVAVHGIDVALSLRIEPFTTSEALDTTAGVVEELLGRSAADLGCSHEELVLWATGRAKPPAGRLDDDVARRLPVIS